MSLNFETISAIYQYVHVLQMKFIENYFVSDIWCCQKGFLLRRHLKRSHRSTSQYDVNNLGTSLLLQLVTNPFINFYLITAESRTVKGHTKKKKQITGRISRQPSSRQRDSTVLLYSTVWSTLDKYSILALYRPINFGNILLLQFRMQHLKRCRFDQTVIQRTSRIFQTDRMKQGPTTKVTTQLHPAIKLYLFPLGKPMRLQPSDELNESHKGEG